MDPATLVGAWLLGATTGALSTPHCAAMCGPLAAFAASGDPPGRMLPGMRGRAWLAGRALGYTVAGGLVGALAEGALAAVPFDDARMASTAGTLVSLALAGALALTGARLVRCTGAALAPLRLVPLRLTGAGRVVLGTELETTAPPASPSPRAPFAACGLGASTALLPCGALWAALSASAATGHAATGALAMLGFAFASSPGLVAATSIARAAAALDPGTRRALGVALLAGAAVLALRPALASRSETSDAACHAPSLSIPGSPS